VSVRGANRGCRHPGTVCRAQRRGDVQRRSHQHWWRHSRRDRNPPEKPAGEEPRASASAL